MKMLPRFSLCALWFVASSSTSLAIPSDVPTPEAVLGYRVGADYKLASYDESITYFRRLDAASERLELVEIGRTSFNRPWYIAFVSSPENLANLEEYRKISQELAHPQGLSDEAARQLARRGKATPQR